MVVLEAHRYRLAEEGGVDPWGWHQAVYYYGLTIPP